MKKTIAHRICLIVLLNVGCCQYSFARDTVLVECGKAHATIFVPARVMDDRVKTPEPNGIWHKLTDETSRIRLRESTPKACRTITLVVILR
jgi:hypothetical protein